MCMNERINVNAVHSGGQLLKPLSSEPKSRWRLYSRFNEALQGAPDKAEPGEMNFSSVSLEGSRPPRGIQQLSQIDCSFLEEQRNSEQWGFTGCFPEAGECFLFTDSNIKRISCFFSFVLKLFVLKLVRLLPVLSCALGLVSRT